MEEFNREQCGPMGSVKRSHQLPCGPEEGRPAQGDQMVAVVVSKWERVRPGLGMAGRGNGDKGNGGLVRRGRVWRRARVLGLLGDRAGVGEVGEQ